MLINNEPPSQVIKQRFSFISRLNLQLLLTFPKSKRMRRIKIFNTLFYPIKQITMGPCQNKRELRDPKQQENNKPDTPKTKEEQKPSPPQNKEISKIQAHQPSPVQKDENREVLKSMNRIQDFEVVQLVKNTNQKNMAEREDEEITISFALEDQSQNRDQAEQSRAPSNGNQEFLISKLPTMSIKPPRDGPLTSREPSHAFSNFSAFPQSNIKMHKAKMETDRLASKERQGNRLTYVELEPPPGSKREKAVIKSVMPECSSKNDAFTTQPSQCPPGINPQLISEPAQGEEAKLSLSQRQMEVNNL